MKNIPSILFIVILAIGTAQAQLASDKPALLLPVVNSLSKPANGQVKLASEIDLPDTLQAKNARKVPLANHSTLKLASDAEIPKSTAKEKN